MAGRSAAYNSTSRGSLAAGVSRRARAEKQTASSLTAGAVGRRLRVRANTTGSTATSDTGLAHCQGGGGGEPGSRRGGDWAGITVWNPPPLWGILVRFALAPTSPFNHEDEQKLNIHEMDSWSNLVDWIASADEGEMKFQVQRFGEINVSFRGKQSKKKNNQKTNLNLRETHTPLHCVGVSLASQTALC